MDDALRSLGADPDSIMYKGGKIAERLQALPVLVVLLPMC